MISPYFIHKNMARGYLTIAHDAGGDRELLEAARRVLNTPDSLLTHSTYVEAVGKLEEFACHCLAAQSPWLPVYDPRAGFVTPANSPD